MHHNPWTACGTWGCPERARLCPLWTFVVSLLRCCGVLAHRVRSRLLSPKSSGHCHDGILKLWNTRLGPPSVHPPPPGGPAGVSPSCLHGLDQRRIGGGPFLWGEQCLHLPRTLSEVRPRTPRRLQAGSGSGSENAAMGGNCPDVCSLVSVKPPASWGASLAPSGRSSNVPVTSGVPSSHGLTSQAAQLPRPQAVFHLEAVLRAFSVFGYKSRLPSN